MTILVDAARWPWRETLWCHLVSDSNFEELHTFAARLGCRRIGFQGDHYDINIDSRTLAVEYGAQVCDSRELVRRLRTAGLRVRPSTFEKWQLDDRGEGALTNANLDELHNNATPMREAALLQLESVPGIEDLRRRSSGWFVLRRSTSAAIVLYGSDFERIDATEAFSKGDDGEHGIFVRTDKSNTSASWSIEVVNPVLQPNE